MKKLTILAFALLCALPALGQGATNPCASYPVQRVNINFTANTQLVTGVTGQKIYICHVFISPLATATNIAFASGTGSVCGSNTTGVITGGDGTAAKGANLAANSGWVQGTGAAVVDYLPVGMNLCLNVSAANQISGIIQYVIAP